MITLVFIGIRLGAFMGVLGQPTEEKLELMGLFCGLFMKVVHDADSISNLRERESELAKLGGEIRKRNQMIFFSGVENQDFPINRQIGGRWFDETLLEPSQFEMI